MAYRVDLTARASRDLRHIYHRINAKHNTQAQAWFNGLEIMVFSLDKRPARGAPVPERQALRQLLYGRRQHRYRIIYSIDEPNRAVTVLHIRHGARDAFNAGGDP